MCCPFLVYLLLCLCDKKDLQRLLSIVVYKKYALLTQLIPSRESKKDVQKQISK